MFVAEFDEFVKKQISYHERQAKIYQSKNDEKSKNSASFHNSYAESFRRLRAYSIAADMAAEEQARQIKDLEQRVAKPIPPANRGVITHDEIAGLPKELLEQLNLPQSDEQESIIVDLINEAGKSLDLDRIMIGLYRRTKTVAQKKALQQKIYRMMDKKLLYKMPRRKGVYTTDQSFAQGELGDDDIEGDDIDEK